MGCWSDTSWIIVVGGETRISSFSIWVISLQHTAGSLTSFWSFVFSSVALSGVSIDVLSMGNSVFPSVIVQDLPLSYIFCVSYICSLCQFLISIGKYSFIRGETSCMWVLWWILLLGRDVKCSGALISRLYSVLWSLSCWSKHYFSVSSFLLTKPRF